MNQHHYILEPYKGPESRHDCPKCNKGKAFARYIDAKTGKHIADNVGRCNREDKCGYHYTPKDYFKDNDISIDKNINFSLERRKPVAKAIKKERTSYIPIDVLKKSLQKYEHNSFAAYLNALFGTEITNELIAKYYIGTSNRWQDATVFWFISSKGEINAGQVKLFNNTGHTVKYINSKGEEKKCTDWVHSILSRQSEDKKLLPEWLQNYLNDVKKVECLFGEHLLNAPQNKGKTIALCEAPKTAIIASVYLPQFIWIAAGALSWLNAERCQVLKGRHVILFPDLNAYGKWKEKADELKCITRFEISNFLEEIATFEERGEGLDLADYLVRYRYSQFKPNNSAPEGPQFVNGISVLIEDIICKPCETVLPKDWGGFCMQLVRTNKGDFDVLYDADGNPVQEKDDQVKKIETFFDKQFKKALIEGVPGIAHIIN